MNHLQYLTIPPAVQSISMLVTPEVEQYRSTHNIPIYEIRKKGCGILLIELVFRAGRPQEAKKLMSSSACAMMREGAGRYNSHDYSEAIDYLGATISTQSGLDFIAIKAVCLKKHLDEIVELLTAMLCDPHLDQNEWKHYIEKSKERLKIQLAKNDVKSYRVLTEEIYGNDHPYGYNSRPELYDALSVDDLRNHHEDYLNAMNCQIFISGDIGYEDRKSIDHLCKSIRETGKSGREVKMVESVKKPENIRLTGGNKQTSIRIGRRTFTRGHKDFNGLYYLNIVLGGYFGSRLVSKIREEKGLTYNIYSMLDSHVYDGDFSISTEVANENVNVCLEEIYTEMGLLSEELLNEEEMQLVNNYMMGNYLNLFDGPFNSIRAIKSLALADIPLDDIDTVIKSSLSVSPYQLRDMAQKYFNRNDFWNVIVGQL